MHVLAWRALTFITCSFTLVSLTLTICLSVFIRKHAYEDIDEFLYLQLSTAETWGAVPGTKNASYLVNFTLFNLSNTVNDSSYSNFSVTDIKLKTPYNYSFQYVGLDAPPNTEQSVSFYEAYSYTYTGSDEYNVKQTNITSLNYGGLKGFYLASHLTHPQIFIQALYRIRTTILYTTLPNMFANYLYQTAGSQTWTQDNIFTPAGFSTQLSDKIWSDPVYGWSTAATFSNWVNLVYTCSGITGLSNNMEYGNVVANYFDLSLAELDLIIGENSVLAIMLGEVEENISSQEGCENAKCCIPDEYFAMQISNGNLTKNPPSGNTPQSSLYNLNNSLPGIPEFLAINSSGIEISLAQMVDLVELTSYDSIFRYENVNLIKDQHISTIGFRFELDQMQATLLKNYYKYFTETFGYTKHSEESKFAAELASTAIYNITQQLGAMISYNLTLQALQKYIQLNGAPNCVTQLENPTTTNISALTCARVGFTFPIGQYAWIQAYLDGPSSSSWKFIHAQTNATNGQIQYVLSQTGFGQIIQGIVTNFSQAFGCSSDPCTIEYLGQNQWATSKITQNLPIYYFPTKYNTILSLLPGAYKFQPEFSAYCSNVLQSNILYPQAYVSTAFSYNLGSILNKFQIFNFVNLFNQNNFTQIQQIFGLDSPTASALTSYLHMLFIQTIGGLTTTHSIYDWVWGYTDPFIQTLTEGNCYEGAQPFDSKVALRSSKSKNATEVISSKIPPNMISSGYTTMNNYRRVTGYQGNSTLSVRRNIYDCKINTTQYTNAWFTSKAERIAGTDMIGFMPDVEINKSLSIFNPRLMRTQTYLFNQSILSQNTYTFLTFNADTSFFKKEKEYNILETGLMNLSTVTDSPLLVSQLYYSGVDNKTISNLRLNGSLFSAFQKNVSIGKVTVEMNTGTTLNYTNTLQYSVYYKNPFNYSSPYVFIPLIAITENYTIPQSQYKQLFSQFSTSFVYAKYSLIIGVLLTMAFCAFSLIMCVGWQNRVKGEEDDSSFKNTRLLRELSQESQMISTINVPKSYLTLEHQSCADDVRLLAELRTYSGSRQRKESREDFTLGDTFDGSRIDTGGSRIETPMKS